MCIFFLDSGQILKKQMKRNQFKGTPHRWENHNRKVQKIKTTAYAVQTPTQMMFHYQGLAARTHKIQLEKISQFGLQLC